MIFVIRDLASALPGVPATHCAGLAHGKHLSALGILNRVSKPARVFTHQVLFAGLALKYAAKFRKRSRTLTGAYHT